MIVICAGLRRSGSYNMYQIVRAILADGGVVEIDPKRMCSQIKQYGDHISVLRLHSYASCLDSIDTAMRVVMTVRDPRDIVISTMNKYKYGFDRVMAQELPQNLADGRVWLERVPEEKLKIVRYSEFIRDKPATITEVATFLGLNITDYSARSLAAEWSMARNLIRQSEEHDPSDYEYVPKNHIHDGAVGGWKEVLTARQAERVEQVAKDWMTVGGFL